MVKKSRLEIDGIFFKDFTVGFARTLGRAMKNLNLSEKELKTKLQPKVLELLSLYEETLATAYLNNHKLRLPDFLRSHSKNQKHIVQNNRESFTYFILYINGSANLYDSIVNMTKGKRLNLTLKLCISLYGLVLRRAQQIADLLIDGYIDGAMIMWRSMYENAISLLLLALEDDLELSRRFYDHSIRNSSRKVASYVENYQALKFKALPKKTHEVLEQERNKLIAKYGKDFLKNDYGWADYLFNGHANFKLVEERVEMNRFRPYYVLCSEQIHSNFNSFKGFMDKKRIVLPKLLRQESEREAFIDPMQFTVSILDEVNDYIFWQFSVESERRVNQLLFTKIFEKLQASYDSR